jgi:antitoxin component YwqK of YwqJK toxin-antitoxin module
VRCEHITIHKKQNHRKFISPQREDNEKFVGRYHRFYENGNLMMDGTFDDGKKSGPFTEYHENGKIARKLSYVNGLRHGTGTGV